MVTLPSILDIVLARCSSKTNSIVKDPTHPSHSLFQLLPSGRRYRSIRARSARLLNSFFPQAVRALNPNHPTPLWNPMQPLPPETWTIPPSPNTPQPYHTKEKTVNFFCAIQSVLHTGEWACTNHLYNTLSSMHTRHFSHTAVCTQSHKRLSNEYVYMLMHYKSSCTVPQPAADSQCFSLHMYSIYVKHSYSLYFLS